MIRPVRRARLVAPILVLLSLVTAARHTGAQVQPTDAAVYTIPGIVVEATADTTDLARDLAFSDGQRQAAASLFQRLGVAPTQLDPAALSDLDLAGLVQSFQIASERTTPGRYAADLTVRFRPEAVRSLLRSRGIVFSETAPAASSQLSVLLPVYRDADGTRLWDPTNAWHEAWLSNASLAEAVPLVVPFGDLRDVQAIDADRAIAGDSQALQTVNELYDADETVVAIAEPQSWTLAVTLTRYGADMLPRTAVFSVPGDPSDPTVLRQAIEQSVARMLEDRSAAAAGPALAPPSVPGTAPQTFAGSATVTLRVPLASRDDWFRTRQGLSRVGLVSDVRLRSLTVREVLVELDYVGSPDDLRSALASQGLILEEGAAGPELRLAY